MMWPAASRVPYATPSRSASFPIAGEVATRSWAWLDAHDEHFSSFVDASSFALMQSLDIHQVLTFDDDFAAAGFVVVRD